MLKLERGHKYLVMFLFVASMEAAKLLVFLELNCTFPGCPGWRPLQSMAQEGGGNWKEGYTLFFH